MPGRDIRPEISQRAELRRWWEEHSKLDKLVEAFIQTLREGSVPAAIGALDELAQAFETHMSVEEDVYFPLVEKLHGAQIPLVREAREFHPNLRAGLAEIRSRLDQRDPAAAHQKLSSLLDLFRLHEQTESKLIATLEHPASS